MSSCCGSVNWTSFPSISATHPPPPVGSLRTPPDVDQGNQAGLVGLPKDDLLRRDGYNANELVATVLAEYAELSGFRSADRTVHDPPARNTSSVAVCLVTLRERWGNGVGVIPCRRNVTLFKTHMIGRLDLAVACVPPAHPAADPRACGSRRQCPHCRRFAAGARYPTHHKAVRFVAVGDASTSVIRRLVKHTLDLEELRLLRNANDDS